VITIIGLKPEFPLPADVVQVARNRAEVVAVRGQHLIDCLISNAMLKTKKGAIQIG
jgi:hypothetical protein